MFFLLTLISTLIFQPAEAQTILTILCSKRTALDKVPGCFDAVRLASGKDIRWLSRDCCKAVKTLPDCPLIVYPDRAYNTLIFKSICAKKFPRIDFIKKKILYLLTI